MCFIIFSYNNYLSKFPNRVIAGFVKNTNGPCKGKVEAKHDFQGVGALPINFKATLETKITVRE